MTLEPGLLMKGYRLQDSGFQAPKSPRKNLHSILIKLLENKFLFTNIIVTIESNCLKFNKIINKLLVQ